MYNRGAGGALTNDFINAASLNDYDAAHTLSADGAIDPHTPGRYKITKATAAALTLGAPTVGLEDGLLIEIVSGNSAQHQITATGLFQDGAGHQNTATWPANPGGCIDLVALQGKWLVLNNNNVVLA